MDYCDTIFHHENTNQRENQQKATNHASDTDFKNFMKLYKDCTKELFSFFVSDTFLPSDNSLRFKKNIL